MTASSHHLTGLKAKIQDFLDDHLPSKRLRQKTGFLSTGEGLLRVAQELTLEEQAKLVDKIDQVCRSACLSTTPPTLLSTQLYPTLSAEDARTLNVLGELCSVLDRLPTSAVISAGLERHGATSIGSGGVMNVWLGVHDGERVVIKEFRAYPESMAEVKKVRIDREKGARFKTILQILLRRAVMWKRLAHPNVNAFLGATAQSHPPALVYGRAVNDNIISYLEIHPDAPRLTLVQTFLTTAPTA